MMLTSLYIVRIGFFIHSLLSRQGFILQLGRYFICLVCFFGFSILTQQQATLAQPLEPQKSLTQYLLHNWTTENGLPSNTLNKLIQTQDGYIWAAGYNGLVRFDGTYFTVFNRRNTPALLTNSISDFYETADGKLWIGTSGGGLVLHEKDSFRILQTKTVFNYPIEKIFKDNTHRLWVGTRSEGVFSFEGGDFKTYNAIEPLRDVSVKTIVQDSQGTIWFGTEGKGLVRLADETFDNFTTKNGLTDNEINHLTIDRKNRLWIATAKGLSWLEDKQFYSLSALKDLTINKILIDKYDCLWLGTTKGLYRLKPQKDNTWEIEILSEDNGLPYKEITDLIFDKEGNLWIATYRGGLCRLQDGKFTNYTLRDGLSSQPISSICEYKEGQYLVGTDVGVIHLIAENKVLNFPVKNNLKSERIRHLYKDKQGNIWVSTYAGLLKIDTQSGKETLYTEENLLPDKQVRVVYEDKKGNVWIGMKVGGVLKLSANGETKVYNKLNILRSNFIMSITEDQEGNMVIGTNESGLMVISPDEKATLINTKNGLSSNTVFNVYVDEENRYWVTTGGGLSLIVKDKITSFTNKEGFPEDSPIDILEDDIGTFWIPTYRGILKIKKQHLLDFATKQTKITDYEYYGKYDGMNNQECTGTAKSLKSSDGRLWFPTLGGLAVLDPLKIKMNVLPPPVDIFKVSIDNNEVSPRFPVVIMPNQQRITFEYTALSFSSPEKIKFRYRLKNYDNDWIEAGNTRQAVYTNLPPCKYQFEVIAANADGVWNKTGDTVSVTVKPQFYQTNSFYFVASLFIILATVGLYAWRLNVVKARSRELEEMVTQRTIEISAQKEEMEAQNRHIEEQRQKLQESYDDIKIVSKIGQKVTALLNLNELVSTLYASINEMMKAEGFGIGVYNPRMQRIEFKNYIENNKSSEHFFEMSEKNFLSVQCLERREPIIINDLFKQYQNYITEPKIRGEKYPQSVIYLPLLFENKPLGVITVQSFEKNAYDDHHVTLLQTLASYISIALENTNAYKIIQEKNENITDSIRYGLTIQQAALPSNESINEAWHEYFAFFKPRDIVSGDFYWYKQSDDRERIYWAVVDCTGHGVPGAFMSMLGITFLNEIVSVQKIYSPAKILEQLHKNIRIALNQADAKNTDGMDIALCMFEFTSTIHNNLKEGEALMTFAGAKLPVYYVKNGEFNEIRGTLKSVGGRQKEEYREYAEFKVKLSMGDSVYIFTDGLIDQNDAEGNRFGSQKVKELIQKYHHLHMSKQKEIFAEEFNRYLQGAGVIQRDDVTLLGVRL